VSNSATSSGIDSNLLTSEQKNTLARDGYCLFRNVLSANTIETTLKEINRIETEEGVRAGSEYLKCDDGALRVHNLLEKSELFDRFFTHELVLASVEQILGKDFKLSLLVSRNPIRGRAQKLHVDWRGGPVPAGKYQACTAMWILEDYGVDNGATRVVPGSHRECIEPAILEDRFAPLPGEVQILEKAGTLVVFNAHLWHAGCENVSRRSRASVHAYFCLRSIPQELTQQECLSSRTITRFGPLEKWLLDVQ
jgi:ectoine hydroxylase-related dioxygenase (phytanoyl-CoA dioxygenase family)